MAARRTETPPFRIVHLSDLHLTRTDGTGRTEMDLFRPLKGMNDAFRRILRTSTLRNSDLLIITGDVTDRGDEASWRVFWGAVDGAGLRQRVLVVPGNHDLCCLGSRLPLPHAGYRSADLLRAMAGLRMGDQPVKFPWAVRPDPRVVVFGLNSNNLGNLSAATNAMGRLGYYQLKSLADKLYTHREVPVKIVALRHSPNIPGQDTARKRGLRPMSPLERMGHQIPREQRRMLLLLCLAHRVRLLVHGHLHLAEDRKVSGVRILGAPATTEPLSAGALASDYPLRTYTVQGDGGRVRCELRSVRC